MIAATNINKMQADVQKVVNGNTIKVNKELSTLTTKLEIQKKLNVFCFQLSIFRENLDSLIHGIIDSLHNNLSPYLVPKSSFMRILTEITISLEPILKMI